MATWTGEVFRTNTSQTILGVPNPTYWRMFHGGSGATDERGQLFAVPNLGHFNINAPNGHFQLHTQNVQRARLNGNVTSNMGPPTAPPFLNVNRDGFFALSGTDNAFNNVNSRAPFTRLHLVDNAVDPANPTVYAQEHGYRPWQRNGVTFTGNSDQSYIGHKYDANDNTDFVVQWSDNPNGSPWGVDRMKFVFTTQYNAGQARGAQSVNGLEAIRLWPRNNFDVNVGIGDFFAGNQLTPAVVTDPTERVDILNGRLRIRQLPDDSAAVDSFYVMVVDRTTLTPGNQERGVVKWVDPSTLGGGGADCDWTVENDGTSGPAVSHNVYTAVGVSDDCPDDDDAVGIGLNLQNSQSPGKLAVRSTQYSKAVHVDQLSTEPNVQGLGVEVAGGTTTTTGIHVQTEQGSASGAQNRGVDISAVGTGAPGNSWNYGLVANVVGSSSRTRGITANTFGGTVTGYAGWFQAFDPAPWVYGVSGQARGGQRRIGVEGLAVGSDLNQIGVMGASTSGTGNWPIPLNVPYIGTAGFARRADSTTYAIGVYGDAVGPFYEDSLNTTAWAGYFNGVVKATGKMICTELHEVSDASLKTDVAELTGAMAVVNELRPSTYHFAAPVGLDIDLPTQLQYGFLAQEVEEVLPSLVGRTTFLGEVDSLGNVLSTQSTVRTLNYQGLIPVVVAALKEQHATIDSMQEQLQAAQSAIATMQQQLATCCAQPPVDSDQRSGSGVEGEKLTPSQERLLRIAPNPFTDRTTLFCTLERAGRMQLLANSADGRSLMVLSEGQREAGEFQYEWSTEKLAPGVYYITLLLDGEPVVKRAVKVGR
ncbi:MAG: tail fiber domain-containing protein [Flavobacteriales bacterium]|nr:tail fiber domain-containing protein [Flavobacteriales bacterium]